MNVHSFVSKGEHRFTDKDAEKGGAANFSLSEQS